MVYNLPVYCVKWATISSSGLFLTERLNPARQNRLD